MAADLPLHVFHIVPGRLRQVLPLPDAKPVMTAMPGWKCDIRGEIDYAKLPQAAKNYVDFLEGEIGVPITLVSTGPKRHEIARR